VKSKKQKKKALIETCIHKREQTRAIHTIVTFFYAFGFYIS